MKETELAAKLIPWLESQHYEVYQEVSFGYGRAIDVLAVRGIISWAIEVKTSFSLNVLDQATRNRTLYRSVFVPKSLNHRGDTIYKVAEHISKVGVIECDQVYERIHVRINAPLMRENYEISKKILADLTDLHKVYAKAGSKNTDRLTPYRITMISVKRHIRARPGCTIKEIFEHLGKRHYSSSQSFKQSVASALESFESDWCIVDKTEYPHKYHCK